MEIFDISPPVSEKSALFPGDAVLEKKTLCRLDHGDSVNLTSVSLSPHVGAHADAPFHYDMQGATMEAVDLDPYLGECMVVTCQRRPLILAEDCEPAVRAGAKRVLFRTLSHPDPNVFNSDFTALSPAAVSRLGKAGVILVGIDTPSIDPADSKSLLAHREIFRWNMRNLENLVLKDIADGTYELIALPLRLVGFDASPVRAILRRSPGSR